MPSPRLGAIGSVGSAIDVLVELAQRLGGSWDDRSISAVGGRRAGVDRGGALVGVAEQLAQVEVVVPFASPVRFP